MMPHFHLSLKLAALALAVGSIAASMPGTAPAHARSKTSVKAAMVYNIARFINFPQKQARQAKLRVCGLTSDRISRDLRALNGRSIGRSKIEVKLLASTKQINASCNVVYLETASPRSVAPLTRGQVLIGSSRNFAKNGGTIGLINFGGQVRFVVNDTSAKRAGVSFRAQLLQLAAKVIA